MVIAAILSLDFVLRRDDEPLKLFKQESNSEIYILVTVAYRKRVMGYQK